MVVRRIVNLADFQKSDSDFEVLRPISKALVPSYRSPPLNAQAKKFLRYRPTVVVVPPPLVTKPSRHLVDLSLGIRGMCVGGPDLSVSV
jgi:hypothetical protein